MAPAGVTDVHVHIQPFRMLRREILDVMRGEHADFDFMMRVCDDPEALLAHLDDVGVDRACLINYVAPEVMGYTDAVNDYVIAYAKDHRDRLIPFGSAHPTFTKHFRQVVDDLVHKHEIGGIKIHPPHQLFAPNAYVDGDRNLWHLYETAESAGVPVMIHTGTSVFPTARAKFGDPILCDDVAVDFPMLKIILAHGGRPMWCDTAFFLARRHPNVYLDVSSIPPSRLLNYFPRLEVIADKVLFGSDWPGPGVPGVRENLDGFRRLPLPDDVKDRVLVRNPRKVFGP